MPSAELKPVLTMRGRRGRTGKLWLEGERAGRRFIALQGKGDEWTIYERTGHPDADEPETAEPSPSRRPSSGDRSMTRDTHNVVQLTGRFSATHGLRRTNADKRRAVRLILEDEEWSHWTSNQIANACHVSRGLVEAVRSSLTSGSGSEGRPASPPSVSEAVREGPGHRGGRRALRGRSQDGHPGSCRASWEIPR